MFDTPVLSIEFVLRFWNAGEDKTDAQAFGLYMLPTDLLIGQSPQRAASDIAHGWSFDLLLLLLRFFRELFFLGVARDFSGVPFGVTRKTPSNSGR